MKKKILMIFAVLIAGANNHSPLRAQTVFSRSVDTLHVSGMDRMTVVGGGISNANGGISNSAEHVFSVGDTVSANVWYVSSDSVYWNLFYGFTGNNVVGDSIMIDTLPVHRYYCAVLKAGYSVNNIVWKIDNIVYRTLEKPFITNNAGIDKTDMLLLRYDSIRLFAVFDDLQPDSVVWYRAALQMPPNTGGYSFSPSAGGGRREASLAVTEKGGYRATGYIYNRLGKVIDSAVSETCNINFVYPLEKIVFRSWAGSNDGKPRTVDTLVIDTCIREYVIDTLVFAVGDPYKYQFVPVIHSFDKPYGFTYKWQHDGFAIVEQVDSILQFNPVDFVHSGSYVFIATLQRGMTVTNYRASPIKIVASNTANGAVSGKYVENGTVYSISGTVLRKNVSGYYADIVRNAGLPGGIYFLRTKTETYKFIKRW